MYIYIYIYIYVYIYMQKGIIDHIQGVMLSVTLNMF